VLNYYYQQAISMLAILVSAKGLSRWYSELWRLSSELGRVIVSI